MVTTQGKATKSLYVETPEERMNNRIKGACLSLVCKGKSMGVFEKMKGGKGRNFYTAGAIKRAKEYNERIGVLQNDLRDLIKIKKERKLDQCIKRCKESLRRTKAGRFHFLKRNRLSIKNVRRALFEDKKKKVPEEDYVGLIEPILTAPFVVSLPKKYLTLMSCVEPATEHSEDGIYEDTKMVTIKPDVFQNIKESYTDGNVIYGSFDRFNSEKNQTRVEKITSLFKDLVKKSDEEEDKNMDSENYGREEIKRFFDTMDKHL